MTVCWLVVNTLLGVGMQVVAEAVALGSTLALPRDLLFRRAVLPLLLHVFAPLS